MPQKRSFFFFLFALPLLLSGGWSCKTIQLRDAQEAEKQKRYEEALQSYEQIAKRESDPDAAKAQAARISLLTQREAWRELLGETSALVNFLDADDPWSRRFRSQSALWMESQGLIEKTLLHCGRFSYQKAREHGDSMAFASSIRCFGLYLERFSQGDARQEAALRRGEALAIREGCLPALPWLERASREDRAKKEDKGLGFAARLSLAGCHLRLWQLHREAPADPRWREANYKPAPFQTHLESLRPLLKQQARPVAQLLLQQADQLQRKRFFTESLQLYLLLIAHKEKLPEIELAKQLALQVFGMTDNWAPLLAAMPTPSPEEAKELFWQRVKTLVFIHGMRSAQRSLKRGNTDEAVAQYIKVHKLTQGHPEANTALYQAALALESRKALSKAREIYKRIYTDYPDDRLAVMAWFRFARLLQKEQKYLDAGRAYERLAYFHPLHMIAPRAYFHAAEAYKEQGLTDEYKRVRRLLKRRYPQSMEAKKAP
jgi:TolA-binding protein